ncbi:MAG: serine hydrolase domain-containing protein, partial [Desertimonas sp.]
LEPHGLIIQRHGRRIVEGYWAPHLAGDIRLVYSLSKTFTGTALGLAVGEGRLSLDDLVADHLPDEMAGAADITRRMRIRHIASMATGHDREMLPEALVADPHDPVRGFFTIAPDAEPGSLFAYNQPPVLALATILQRLTGERLVDYLRPRVFDPIGIGDLRWARPIEDIDLGFSGVHTTLDAIARLGQLYLDDGVWDGQRRLPEGWVAQASSVQSDNWMREEPDWQQGYGFQLWMSKHGFRGDGAFGQYMVVLPQHDVVVAMFSCVENMQTVMDLMWEHLLPAFGTAPAAPGPGDAALAERLATLTQPTAGHRLGGGPPRPPSGGYTKKRLARSHSTITAVEVADDVVVIREDDWSVRLPLSLEWSSASPQIATSATTTDDGRTIVDVAFLATPHRLELNLEPRRRTFVARWPLVPLFGAGIDRRLSSMVPPD